MKELFKSLGAFQRECPIIHKGTKGYSYTYTDLPEIYRIIIPILSKNDLVVSQPLTEGSIKTILFHTKSGEVLESITPLVEGVTLKGMNEFQVLGSQITYLRRYALSSMLGIVTDKDLDASGVQSSKTMAKKKLTQAMAISIKEKIKEGANKEDVAKYLEKFEEDTRVKDLLKMVSDE